MNQKKLLYVYLLVIGLFLVIAGSVYSLKFYRSLNPLKDIAQNIDTLSHGLSTYTDSKAQFSLTYPKSWVVTRENNFISFRSPAKANSLESVGLTVSVFPNASQLTAHDYLETYFYKDWPMYADEVNLSKIYLKRADIKSTSINGIPAEEIADLITPPGSAGSGVWLRNGDYGIFLQKFNTSNPEEQTAAFNQVLSSFKLTENLEVQTPLSVKVIDGDIYTVRNGLSTRLTYYGHNFNPIISPDKTKIAYLSLSSKVLEGVESLSANNVWVIDIYGNNPIQATPSRVNITRDNLTWLDNNQLLFSEGRDSVKSYSLDSQKIDLLVGSTRAIPICKGTCSSFVTYAFSPSQKYLVKIDASQNQSKITSLDLSTKMIKEFNIDKNIQLRTFSEDGKKFTYQTIETNWTTQTIDLTN